MTRSELTAALDRVAGAEHGKLADTIQAVLHGALDPLGMDTSPAMFRDAAWHGYDEETDNIGDRYVVVRMDGWAIVEQQDDSYPEIYRMADLGFRFDTKAEADRMLAAEWLVGAIDAFVQRFWREHPRCADVDLIVDALGFEELKRMRAGMRDAGRTRRAA